MLPVRLPIPANTCTEQPENESLKSVQLQIDPTQDTRLEPDSAPSQAAGPSARSWQSELTSAVRNVTELRRLLRLTDEVSTESSPSQAAAAEADAGFPVFVTSSFLQRMQPGNPLDPLLLQVLPGSLESVAAPGFVADAVGDLAARRSPGLLQKYAGRALLMVSGTCAIHCRYCFRREYPYHEDPRTMAAWEPALQQLAEDYSLTEVILSGGDPLMLTDARLRAVLERLAQVKHIQRLRIHTRLPIVIPSRVTQELLELLGEQSSQVIVVVHANHPQELDESCSRALRRLVCSGLPVLNQTVLLRGINDSADTLEKLSLRLTSVGVMPYYLHQLDRVSGTAHFEVPVEEGQQLIAELSRRLPGYAVPRYVQEIPGEAHKTRL